LSASETMKLLTGAMEAVLAVPVPGGFLMPASGCWILVAMCVLHAAALIVCVRHRDSYSGSVMGIIPSMLAWIPFPGWLLHLVTAVLLFVSALRRR